MNMNALFISQVSLITSLYTSVSRESSSWIKCKSRLYWAKMHDSYKKGTQVRTKYSHIAADQTLRNQQTCRSVRNEWTNCIIIITEPEILEEQRIFSRVLRSIIRITWVVTLHYSPEILD